MHIKQFKFGGWEHNFQLANDQVELVISLDVGPRILSYKTPQGENVLKNFPDQMGKSGEQKWMIRGGHRFWIAPEDEVLSYVPDNAPVKYEFVGENGLRLLNTGVDPWKIKKELTVTLAPSSSEVTIRHCATNEGESPIEIATWGLSVMAAEGLAIIPQPPLGQHPRDLLPNRILVVWPYTDMADPRWRFGSRLITLRQTAEGFPTKLGLAHKEQWVAYLMRDALFLKTFGHLEGEAYPDGGCNFETFSNSEMLELESLGPLRRLAPGESTEHTEHWHLLDVPEQPESLKERVLSEWIEPKLRQIGL
ncbi:MAG: hypothetical protein QOD99_329 [Chthoniobacter sp.]|jgi:hypothetical protein|nr:hypothetical protein [Chthoniobacter sp.]